MSSDDLRIDPVTDQDADELADLIDKLMSSGTQHLNLDVGETARVQTINSTDCGKKGACAVPNLSAVDRGEDA